MNHHANFAFFDLDGTLIGEASMTSFLRHFFSAMHPAEGERRWAEFLETARVMRQSGLSRDELNAWYYRTYFTDVPVASIRRVAEQWFWSRTADPAFFKREVIDYLGQHRAQGTGIVLLTGSFREVVALFADWFGASAVICAPLEERDGKYTGALLAPPTIGAGKRVAVARFLAQHGVAAADCFGYGDDDSDIPFLEYLGHPRAVAGGTPSLLKHAQHASWDIVGAAAHTAVASAG